MTGEEKVSKILGLGAAGLLAAAMTVAQPARTDAPRDFGTAHLTYVQIPGTAFFPRDSANAYGTTATTQVLRTSLAGAPGDSSPFTAPVNLPSGALVKYLELDACEDSGGIEPVEADLIATDNLGNITHISNSLATDGSGCKVFSEDLTSEAIVIDSKTNHYYIECSIPFTIAFHIGLAGMVVGYQLQVSPAPATATFADVPTSFLYFRAIEALAASGITTGCGSGNFCPNQNVTRGELAKFLANALGLYWQ